jgi:hypothetical protein
MPSMSILVTVLSLITFLDVLAMDSLGHHILLISTCHHNFVWRHLNDNMYRNNPHIVDELKEDISSVVT